MRISILAALAVAAAAPATAQVRVVPVTDFDRVVVEGPFEVIVGRGNVTRALVEGAARSTGSVSLDVQGRTLRIRRNPNNWGGYPGSISGTARVTLWTRELRGARVIGAGSLAIDGVRGMRLDLSVEGSGRIRAEGLAVDQLSAGIRGSGEMSLAGQAERLNMDVQGAGSLDAERLETENLTLIAASTGTITTQARRSAAVTSNGLGVIRVLGSAACTVRGPTAASVACGSVR